MKVRKRHRFEALLLIVFIFIAGIAGCSGGGGGGGTTPLSDAKAITAFSFISPAATGTIDENAKTIAVTVPNVTNVTALVATFTTTGASVKVGSTIQVSGTTANNFTSPVAYTVTAADGTTATYTVTVTVTPSSEKAMTAFLFKSPATTGTIDENAKTIVVVVPNGTNVTALIATFNITGVSANVGGTVQVSGTTANNFTGPVAYTVTAANSTTATYIVTVSTSAAATSAIKLPKTGLTTCYDSAGAIITCTNTGQDGELQKGVAWPSPRFTNADNSTPINGNVVVDQLTGLMWTRDGNAPGPPACTPALVKTWQDALDYAACLNTNSYLGYADWRLPNRKELKSLVNYGQPDTATWLNTQGFTNAKTDSYWSSTSYATNTGHAWDVSLIDGVMSDVIKTINHYVWPVRAGQGSGAPAEQPKTGQTICSNSTGTVITCTNTGQDGELQKGVAWPSPRFTNADNSTPINGNVVVDQLTGLMWTKDGNAPGPASCTPAAAKTWQDALDYVACLNTNSYLGYADWRLPDVNELESLVNADQSNTATWLNTQGFSHVQFQLYWSSTSYAADGSHAWFVDMFDAFVNDVNKTNIFYVWPVRAGQ